MYVIRTQKKNRTKTTRNTYNILVIQKNRGVTSQKAIKKLGSYDQQTKTITLNINSFLFWISKGCTFSKNFYKLINIYTKIITNPIKKHDSFKF